ncbi:endonuclease domain-containing protein [Achromobacter insolitus]|uniref:endonuclease domain-containing protein n=1 Tax=Achromobacter insolitus TaxID=217204 RepID=UPI000B21E4A6|nr:endonuclease domain-containing protein [Achromobacter insolitus]
MATRAVRAPVAKMTAKRAPKAPSALEERFARDLRALKVLEAQREYRFAPPRMWRFDFAWPEQRFAVEIEGGVWTNGRHTRGSGFVADTEKYNAAALAGWKVLRFTEKSVRDGSAVELVARVLRVPPYNPGIV